ncbi:IS3 family transposase, partial [Lactococcus garvieae]|uniref:IS3 family transposase n=1 Tax=Lactococcus garvieae TaxID=1363 RepID=UPI0032B82F74
MRTKRQLIKKNSHKYPISALCKALNLSRATYYYEPKEKPEETALEAEVIQVFHDNRKAYGTRRIKPLLKQQVSRRKIGQIMRKYNLVSVYTKRKFRVQTRAVNNANIENVLDRKFKDKRELEVLVSDLTYVDVLGNWNYVCLVLDLFNREIVGHAVGEHKNAALVQEALSTIPYDCSKIQMFHTDRGKEFDNAEIEEFLSAFHIQRSLSHKATPHDNAVAEATYKAFKAEFIYQ